MPKSIFLEKYAATTWPVKVWDFLAWLTVLFPIFAGGFWVHRPGLKFELAQVSIPVLALALLGLLLYRLNPTAVANASSLRLLGGLWRQWQEWLAQNPRTTICLSFLFFGSLWAGVSLARHWAFLSGYADLGIFVNGIWNLTHGYGYMSSVKDGINLFSDHQSPIFWLLAPAFKLFPRAETLLIAQGFGLCAGGIALYLIGRQYLPSKSPFLAALPLIYWFYNPLRNANRFDFHPEVFLVPCFLFGIWGLQEKSWRRRIAGYFFLILALMGKESSGPVLAGIGAAWLLGAAPAGSQFFCRVNGPILALVGVAHLYFCTKIVPTYFTGIYLYQNMYAQFGSGLEDLLLAPITQPALFLSHLVGLARLKFFAAMVAPLAFLPLLAPTAFLAAVPGFLIYFLSEHNHRLMLGYHYGIESSVGVLWALAVAFGKIEARQILAKIPRPVFAYAILTGILVAYGRGEIHLIRRYEAIDHYKWVQASVFPALPPEATISSTGAMVPHLAARHWAHHIPAVEIPGKGFVDCVLWSRHPQVNNSPMNPDYELRINTQMKQQKYREIWACDSLTIYQHPNYAGECIPRAHPCEPHASGESK
jgi:uncharacterized membrane protein